MTGWQLRPIGVVRSSIRDSAAAPRQSDEGAPEAWLVFQPDVIEALRNVAPGDQMILITWLHQARRDVLRVHPRGDLSRPEEGVFSTRSPHRPNPLGLHRVEITAVDGGRLKVRSLEAIDGTPIVDLKPILSEEIGMR